MIMSMFVVMARVLCIRLIDVILNVIMLIVVIFKFVVMYILCIRMSVVMMSIVMLIATMSL